MRSWHGRSAAIAALAALAAPATLYAHPWHAWTGFGSGLAHPFAGADHLLAAFAVGLVATRWDGGRRWLLPAAFASALTVGWTLGSGVTALPVLELALAGSVLALGGLLWLKGRPGLGPVLALAALFGLAHGGAHGLDLGAGGLSVGLGLTLGTLSLHGAGVAAGAALARSSPAAGLRAAGAMIALAGVWLAAGI